MKAWHIEILVKSAAGQTVAKASSEQQAKRFAADWDAVTGARASAEKYAKVMRRLEKAHGITKAAGKPGAGGSKRRCGACGKYSKSLGAAHNWCTRCGHGLNGQGAAKAGGQAAAKARCHVCGLLGKDGADNCARCDSKLPPASMGESGEADRSFTCAGCSAPVHADREACPHCGQIAGVAKSAALAGIPAGEQVRLSRLVAKARGGVDSSDRAAAIGELMEKVGREVATALVAGDLVSPSQFTRAYLSQGRTPQSGAAGGRPPRIPDTSHVISGDDFRRPALEAGHQRPNPLSPLETLQQAGQMGVYGPGLGVRADDRYATSPTSTTLAPGLAAAQQLSANAPMPGDARPW